MKILKFIFVLLAISLITFFTHFNNTKRVNPVVANYYSTLKESLKEKGYSNNLLVISTKRSKWENIFFENFSAAAHDSRHLTNDAMDFLVGDINNDNFIDGKDVAIIYQVLNDEIILNQGGIGTYKKQGFLTKQMVHLDCRVEKKRWNY
ncbi:hypothetical protein [Mariniphaga sp.]|uniref:hypothetical protein n=1 Tax=Mariniphaga sp. TaxID=1954475 RepID=UPI003567187D